MGKMKKMGAKKTGSSPNWYPFRVANEDDALGLFRLNPRWSVPG